MDNSYLLRRAGRRIQPGASETAQWKLDLEQAQHTQLDRVQASARVWLGVLTTLLTLLGSVVLFKGGSLVTEVTPNWGFRVVLIILVGLVFAVAVLAVIFGSQATWGGLSSIIQSTDAVENEDSSNKSWWHPQWYGLAKMFAFSTPRNPARRKCRTGRLPGRGTGTGFYTAPIGVGFISMHLGPRAWFISMHLGPRA